LAKRAERETSEGLVVRKSSADGKKAAIAALCCETDFVAKNDDFVAIAQTLADYALACSAEKGTENILETTVDGKKFSDILAETVSRTGEKTQVGCAMWTGTKHRGHSRDTHRPEDTKISAECWIKRPGTSMRL
jgi:translation elongation factor EF-Ts